MWFLLGMLLLIRVMLIVIKRDCGRLLSNIILLWFFFLFKYYWFIDLFVDDWVVDLGVVVVCFVVLLKIFLKSKWNMFIWFFEIYKYLKKKNFVDICINLEWEMFYILIFINDVCIFCMFIVMLFLRFVWIF